MRFAILSFFLVLFCIGIIPDSSSHSDETPNNATKKANMQLGNFSISLNVKDIIASKEFYEKLGFKVTGGNLKHKYVIMQNDSSTVGLYQGMFEKNSLTYNPGWDRDCKTLAEFQDVREIQQELKKSGFTPVVAADESTEGPAFFTLVDPDGNPILIDQHVAKPTQK
jgi:predicted lactoylglutathione lyase